MTYPFMPVLLIQLKQFVACKLLEFGVVLTKPSVASLTKEDIPPRPINILNSRNKSASVTDLIHLFPDIVWPSWRKDLS